MDSAHRRLLRLALAAAAISAAVVVAIWRPWSGAADPPPPEIPLDGAHPELAAAIRKSREAVLANPKDAQVWGDYASLLVANSFFEHSIPLFERAEQLDPQNPAWPMLRASMLIEFSKPAEAVPLLERALANCRTAEQKSAVHFRLALTLIDLGRLDGAVASIHSQRELDGESPQWRFANGLLEVARGDREAARAHLLAIADHPSAKRQAAALLASLTSDPAEARKYRDRVVGAPQDRPWSNSFDDAVRRFRVTPSDGLDKFRELQAAGHVQEALDHLRELLIRTPTDAVAFNLGYTLQSLGDRSGAEAAFRQAVSLNPQNAQARVFLALVLLERAEAEHAKPGGGAAAAPLFREALQAEEGAIAAESDSALPHYISGRALVRLGESERAKESFRKAAAIDPTLFEAHLALGELLAGEGKLPEAKKHFADAGRVAPDNAEVKRTLEKWKDKK